ncbi:MAG: hypothetical protein R2751_11250 [Bacteroidales bacterium]
MKTSHLKTLNALAGPLFLCMGLASAFGIFLPDTYARELPSFAAQGAGQDVVNLFLGGPLLLGSLWFMNRGSKTASWIYGGMLFYYLYSYIIYTFGIHYNSFFLLYCATLALSTYSFIFWVSAHAGTDLRTWFTKAPPVRFTSVFILVIAALFYMIWLKDILPPLFQGDAPQFVKDNNYQVNAVHAIDLSFALPGLIVVGILLWKGRPMGLLLAPVVLVFIVVLTVALAAMILAVRLRGLSDDASLVVIFGVLALIAATILVRFLKNLANGQEKS